MIGNDRKTERKRLMNLLLMEDLVDTLFFDGCWREIAGLDSDGGFIAGEVVDDAFGGISGRDGMF